MAVVDVGTCTNGTPRMNVAATYPTKSPTTPPPSASMHVSRLQRCSSMKSSMAALTSRLLVFSPAGTWYVSSSFPSSALSTGSSPPQHIAAVCIFAKPIACVASTLGSEATSCTVTLPSARKALTSCLPYSGHTFWSETITNLLALMPFAGVSSAGISVSSPRPTITLLSPMTGMVRRGCASHSSAMSFCFFI